MHVYDVFCFFLQAEDGIRDLVRSRGLGDVYKRQLLAHAGRMTEKVPQLEQTALFSHFQRCFREEGEREGDIQIVVFEPGWFWFIPFRAVSYTHLTLPTSDLV